MTDDERVLNAANKELAAHRQKRKERERNAAEAEKAAALARLERLGDAPAQPGLDEKIEAQRSSVRTAGDAMTKAKAKAVAKPPSKARSGQQRKRQPSRRAKPTHAELYAELLAASTAAELWAALSRMVWPKNHGGLVCPSKRHLDPHDMSRWRGRWLFPPGMIVHPFWTESIDLFSEVYGRCVDVILDITAFNVCIGFHGDNGVATTVSYVEVHAAWLELPEPRPRHPLALLVEAWQETSVVSVKVDRHRLAILPASLRDAHRDHATLPLALDRTTPIGHIPKPEQGYLPGMEPAPSLVPPVPWLTLYDLTGSGQVQTRGRGAPLAQRLFVEILTAVHIGDRDPEWITAPPITLRDLFEWCWPRYWDTEKLNKQTGELGDWSGGYERNKHLPLLRDGLVELDNLRIVYDRYERRLIRIDDLPIAATALDDPIRVHVRHLHGSDRGPMLDRAPARRWGVVSAPAWRSTIRLSYLWDEAKLRNHGARVYAHPPGGGPRRRRCDPGRRWQVATRPSRRRGDGLERPSRGGTRCERQARR